MLGSGSTLDAKFLFYIFSEIYWSFLNLFAGGEKFCSLLWLSKMEEPTVLSLVKLSRAYFKLHNQSIVGSFGDYPATKILDVLPNL